MSNILVAWFISNIKEPGTWAGTGVLALTLHQLFPGNGPLISQILLVGSSLAGLLAYFLPSSRTSAVLQNIATPPTTTP